MNAWRDLTLRSFRALMLLMPALLPPGAVAQTPEGRLYTPGAFEAIEIAGAAAVRFTQGAPDSVFVEGDEETQKSLSIEVRDGVLQIRPTGGWKFWNARRLQMTVTARELRRVVISGAADLVAALPVQAQRLDVSISGAGLARFDKLRADSLYFHVSGAGDGQITGSVGELNLSVSGRSEFRGENLQCGRANVKVSGIGDVKVWATEQLGVSVSGIGTVDYWGSPQVVRRSSGIAKINDRGPKPAQP